MILIPISIEKCIITQIIKLLKLKFVELDSSVYQWAMGWIASIWIPAGTRDFSLHSFQSISGSHPASYPMGTGGCFAQG
jgi:hypothetical protein